MLFKMILNKENDSNPIFYCIKKGLPVKITPFKKKELFFKQLLKWQKQ